MLAMDSPLGTIRSIRSALANNLTNPARLADAALTNSNRNQGRNTYIWRDAAWTRSESERVQQNPPATGGAFGDGRDTLWGLPVSVKDCFDLAGAPTSFGTRYYAETLGIANLDSWLVERLRERGAVITGKTHLHPLAWGITGENPDFGDCLQPANPALLTGGSSSGACASVLEGSAVVAIGTDTGGSIRVPAALCGLAGYRASLGRGNWRGAGHLAPSFDTMGFLFADLEEAPLLAGFFSDSAGQEPAITAFATFAFVDEEFLHDCEPEIIASYRDTIAELQRLGLSATRIDVDWWAEAGEIFAPIQASEAAAIHQGHFEHFEPLIRERLEWGARLAPSEIAALRDRHAAFLARMDELFARHQVILLPASPVSHLYAGADHSDTRRRLLRYTTPFSLAGVPAVTIPCATSGMQVAAAREQDESLLQLVALLATRRKASPPVLNS